MKNLNHQKTLEIGGVFSGPILDVMKRRLSQLPVGDPDRLLMEAEHDELERLYRVVALRDLPEDGRWQIERLSEEDGQPSILRRHDVNLFGQNLHINAVRVRREDEEIWEAVDDPDDLLDGLYEMDNPGEAYQTFEITSHVGRWVLVIVPYCD